MRIALPARAASSHPAPSADSPRLHMQSTAPRSQNPTGSRPSSVHSVSARPAANEHSDECPFEYLKESASENPETTVPARPAPVSRLLRASAAQTLYVAIRSHHWPYDRRPHPP